jgi:hypothetical protein
MCISFSCIDSPLSLPDFIVNLLSSPDHISRPGYSPIDKRALLAYNKPLIWEGVMYMWIKPERYLGKSHQSEQPEQTYSPEYLGEAQSHGRRFVTLLREQGYSLEQIGDVTRAIQKSFGMDADLFGKPVRANSLQPQELAALGHAADWIAEVNSQAQFFVSEQAGGLNNHRTVPSEALTRFRPSNRGRRGKSAR